MSLQFFTSENISDYKREQYTKLLMTVIAQLLEFSQSICNSISLFYQLDMKKVDNTTICLKNLITSLLLKNPIYSQIINLMKVVYENDITQILQNIKYIKESSGIDYAARLGIDEVAIGRKMIATSNENPFIVQEQNAEDGRRSSDELSVGENKEIDQALAKQAFESTLK